MSTRVFKSTIVGEDGRRASATSKLHHEASTSQALHAWENLYGERPKYGTYRVELAVWIEEEKPAGDQ